MKRFFTVMSLFALCANVAFAQDPCDLVSGTHNLVPDGTIESLPTDLDADLPALGFDNTWGNASWGTLRIIEDAPDTESPYAFCGLKCVGMQGTGGEIGFKLPWIPAETYVLRVWVKTNNPDFSCGLSDVYIDGDDAPDKAFSMPDTQGAWQVFETEFTTGDYAGMSVDDDGNLTGKISFYSWWSSLEGAAYLYFDNWELYVKSDVPSEIDKVVNKSIEAFGADKELIVSSPSPVDVSVYSVSGALLMQKTVSGTTVIPMPKGLYIVKADGFVNRVMVK